MDALLREFADGLAPTDDELERCREAGERVRSWLKSIRDIDRIIIVGSLGKKTGLRGFVDCDIIVYINAPGDHLAFDKVRQDKLDEIHTSLELGLSQTVTCNNYHVALTLNGMECQVLPARNMLTGVSHRPGGEDGIKEQHRRVLDLILGVKEKDRRKLSLHQYSTSLSEACVLFAKKQTAFAHSVARLGKLWSNSLYLPGFKHARSFMMELIAFAATARTKSDSMMKAFREFLQIIFNFRSMNIVFDDIYTESEVPKDVLLTRPLLLDPTNPYNNLLAPEENQRHMEGMAVFAKETLCRLDSLSDGAEGPRDTLGALFSPQPKIQHLTRTEPVNEVISLLDTTHNHAPHHKLTDEVLGRKRQIKEEHYFAIRHFVELHMHIQNFNKCMQTIDPEPASQDSSVMDRMTHAVDHAFGYKPRCWRFSEREEERSVEVAIPICDGTYTTLLLKFDLNGA